MIHFPPFGLDTANHCLWQDSRRISVPPKAFLILKHLAENAGRLVTHEELLRTLWPDAFVQPDVLKTHMVDVRQALGDEAKNPRFIETQPRRGYRFIAEIRNND